MNVLKHMESIFEEIRSYIWTEGYKNISVVKKNPRKGDVSTGFDLGAEKVIVEYCKKNRLAVRILSEESGSIDVSEFPEWTLVIDPVDGSTNMKKGIEGTAFSVAIIPSSEKLDPRMVQFAFVGSIVSGSFCRAEKGKGTFYKGIYSGDKIIQVRTSSETDLDKTLIEMDLDYGIDESLSHPNIKEGAKIKRILPLVYPERKVKHVRRGGAAALALMAVAKGSIDSYIDARDILTPENWMAAYLLIKEAGGIMTDIKGNEIKEIRSFTQPFNIIASGNEIIHKKILKLLDV